MSFLRRTTENFLPVFTVILSTSFASFIVSPDSECTSSANSTLYSVLQHGFGSWISEPCKFNIESVICPSGSFLNQDYLSFGGSCAIPQNASESFIQFEKKHIFDIFIFDFFEVNSDFQTHCIRPINNELNFEIRFGEIGIEIECNDMDIANFTSCLFPYETVLNENGNCFTLNETFRGGERIAFSVLSETSLDAVQFQIDNFCSENYRKTDTGCVPCDPYTYSLGTSQNRTCMSCAGNDLEHPRCQCPIGSFRNTSSPDFCVSCPGGYTTNPGSQGLSVSDCSVCDIGFFRSITGECRECPLNSEKALPGDQQCTCTLSGERWVNESCAQCPRGTFVGSDQTCVECYPHETTLNPGASHREECMCDFGFHAVDDVCSPCVRDSYKDFVGDGACVECALYESTVRNAAMSRDDCVCSEGYYRYRNTCIPCNADTFKGWKGDEACAACDGETNAERTHCEVEEAAIAVEFLLIPFGGVVVVLLQAYMCFRKQKNDAP